VQTQIVNNRPDDANLKKADIARSDYADTPYAALVSLVQAKHEYENGDVESAIMHLRWASENATEIDVKHVANLRLARILIAEEKYDEAETVLLADHPAGFTAGYEELKGDLYAAMGDIARARVAYDKAINAAEGSPGRWLILKRQDLGNGNLDNS
jgi:predicted negative regulator of RcsB-dependent stress response